MKFSPEFMKERIERFNRDFVQDGRGDTVNKRKKAIKLLMEEMGYDSSSGRQRRIFLKWFKDQK
jgi:hypothetical protein